MRHARQTLIAMAVFGGFTTYLAVAAQAQIACDKRDSIVAALGEKYGETRRGGGLTAPTAIVEIWASDETGTWTIITTNPQGLTCIMAVGTDWQNDFATLAGKGA